MRKGQSVKNGINGIRRIMYDPDWSPTSPYKTYYNGTAGPEFGSLFYAMYFFGIDKKLWSKPS